MSGGAAPTAGSVIRYAYLWADEHARGAEEGRKDRPALVLALAVRNLDGATEMLVLAVTHAPPLAPDDAIEFPAAEKHRLGLDALASWIVTTEGNAFVWPGPDIRPIPEPPSGRLVYGQISEQLLQQVARSYLSNRRKGIGRVVGRTE
jgi:hypothetical protein